MWGLPPPHPRIPLGSACLADGSLPRATKRLTGGGCAPHNPAFRFARLVLQTARYRGPLGAWQVGAAAPAPPLSAALGLSCRRLATAGNEALGRWGKPSAAERGGVDGVLPDYDKTIRQRGGGTKRFVVVNLCTKCPYECASAREG